MAAVLCLVPAPAHAQISADLRGSVEDAPVDGDILFATRLQRESRQRQDDLPEAENEPEYQPYSEGAVADDENVENRTEPVAVEAPRNLSQRPLSASRVDNRTADARRENASLDDNIDSDAADVEQVFRRTESIDAGDTSRNRAEQPSSERTGAIQGKDSGEQENPYAPLGLRIGTFTVTTSLEQGLTATDNVDSSPGGSDGVLSETTLRLNAVSDWSRHTATLDAYYTQLQSVSGAAYSEPNAGVNGTFTLELGNEYEVNTAAGYQLGRESAVGPANTISRSLRHTIDGSAGFEKAAGKFRYAITGSVQRLQYTGGSVSQSDRNATLLTATLRSGYEISPAIIPFVEAEYGRRIYDEVVDQNGFSRSSDRLGLRLGTEFDFREKFSGELSAGWLQEKLDDATLDPVSGLSVNAALNWSPSRATTVALYASTEVEGTTTAGSSGSLLYSGEATLTRQIRANLETSATVGGYFRDFAGTSEYDLSYRAGVGFTYWLNRYFGLTGRASHETVTSSDSTRKYSANRVFLGVRLQH